MYMPLMIRQGTKARVVSDLAINLLTHQYGQKLDA